MRKFDNAEAEAVCCTAGGAMAENGGEPKEATGNLAAEAKVRGVEACSDAFEERTPNPAAAF
jgi:hypothetical protein